MKKLLQIVLVSSLSLLCFSCYYDELIDEPIAEIPVDPEDPDYKEVFYGADIQPIWDAQCIGCHNQNNKLDLRVDVSHNELVPQYVIAEDADKSPLVIQLESGHYTPNAGDMSLIKGWINQGADNN